MENAMCKAGWAANFSGRWERERGDAAWKGLVKIPR